LREILGPIRIPGHFSTLIEDRLIELIDPFLREVRSVLEVVRSSARHRWMCSDPIAVACD
jgi:hypothetical protein